MVGPHVLWGPLGPVVIAGWTPCFLWGPLGGHRVSCGGRWVDPVPLIMSFLNPTNKCAPSFDVPCADPHSKFMRFNIKMNMFAPTLLDLKKSETINRRCKSQWVLAETYNDMMNTNATADLASIGIDYCNVEHASTAAAAAAACMKRERERERENERKR